MDTKARLDKLITDALKPDNEIAIRNLLQGMEKIDIEVLKAASADLEKLCESWEDGASRSEDIANVCVRLAELGVLDTPEFRSVLHAAIRKLLPPYLVSSTVVKAIGAKDESVSVRDAALRLRKLQHLRSTAVVYQQETHQWAKINNIDNVVGTIGISAINGSGVVSSVPIASAITNLHFFNMTPDMMNLLFPGKVNCRPSAEYRKIFQACTLSELHEQKMKEIIMRLMIPAIMTPESFEAWWSQESAAPVTRTGGRAFWEARSVLELQTLLKPVIESGEVTICAEAAQTLKKLFMRFRKEMPAKEVAMLTDCIAVLANAGTDEVLADMFSPLRGKVPFFPAEISAEMPLVQLEAWGKLSVKTLTDFVKAAAFLYTPEELALLGTQLPLKCMGPVFDTLPEQIVRSTILGLKLLSCDMILWIFRNRAQLPSQISTSIDTARCVAALSIENVPKEWTAAQRDLKKALFDKADFQKYVLENADGDIPSIIGGLQRYRNYQPGERQSILVKLSRYSAELKDYLESGAGVKLMGASAKTKVEEAPVTSIASHKRLADELTDLVSVQIPENAAAVALARSYGDLRENAEYDAAKERRRYLHRRRAELEKILGFIQATDFKSVEVKDHAVIGSVVTLAAADGKETTYYLLGAWDGDPDKNYISYKTKIGEAMLDQQVGTAVDIPGIGKCTIKAVQPLPEELRKMLANEA